MLEWHFAWEISRESPGGFHGDAIERRYGSIVLADFTFDAVHGSRTANAIRQTTDDYIGLALMVEGCELYSQGRQETLTKRHELLLWDAMRPASFQSPGRTRLLNILFPRTIVAQHVPNIDDLSCKKIGPETGNGVILASHVAMVHQVIDTVPTANRQSVFRSTLELLGACFQPEDAFVGGTGYQRALLRKVEAHIRDTLFEPDFGAASVAEHFRVSTRYLYRLFSAAGTSFSKWIMAERLTRAERALASASFSGESITQLALRLGFCDTAHFSRSFKAKYGRSPKGFRLCAGGDCKH